MTNWTDETEERETFPWQFYVMILGLSAAVYAIGCWLHW